MKLLLDQGLPRTSAGLLRTAGFDTVHTGEVGLAAADDLAILMWARAENRTVVTLDADFHQLLALSGEGKPSVIRIRIEGLRATELTRLLCAAIQRCEVEIERGAAVSITPSRIRLRKLPLA